MDVWFDGRAGLRREVTGRKRREVWPTSEHFFSFNTVLTTSMGRHEDTSQKLTDDWAGIPRTKLKRVFFPTKPNQLLTLTLWLTKVFVLGESMNTA